MLRTIFDKLLFVWFAFNCLFCSGVFSSEASSDATEQQAQYFFEHLPKDEIKAPSIKSSAYSLEMNSYVLHWEPGLNKSAINYFYLRYRSRYGPNQQWYYKKLAANYTSYTFQHLSSETKYKVELIGIVSQQLYSRTSISSFQTGKEQMTVTKAPGKPKNDSSSPAAVPPAPDATSIKISYTSVYINWYAKTNGQSPVLRYKLLKSFSERNDTRWVLVDDKIPAMSTSYQVHGLQPGESYKFQLIAINKFGESIPGEISTKVPLVAIQNIYIIPPDLLEVQFINNSTAIQVKWDYNDKEMLKRITKFQIIYDETNKRKPKFYDVENVELREYVIHKVRANKIFQIKMKAFGSDNVNSHYSNTYECNQTCTSLLNQSYNSNFGIEYFDEDLIYPMDSPAPNNYDMAYFISGITFGFVVLVLAISGIVYRHKLADQRKKFECDEENNKNFHQQVCDKVVNHLRKTQQIPQMDLFAKNCCNGTCNNQTQMTNSIDSAPYQEEGGGGGGGGQASDKSEETNRMLDSACHCAATGVAQLPWTKGHVF